MVLLEKNKLSFLRLDDLKQDTIKFLQNAFDEQEDGDLKDVTESS